MRGLIIRKLADKTGEPLEDGSWPLVGIRLEDAPEETTISTSYVTQARSEGWVTVTGETVVARPGGPADDPMRPDKLHIFNHVETITFHTVDGDIRYRVTHQPDKYVDLDAATYPDQIGKDAPKSVDDSTPVTPELYGAGATRVDHFYGITKEA